VREIVELARARNGGIPTIVDGAHAFAHFDFKLSDLGCDYYGVSLHKWLSAPHGTGLLYVRKDKIAGLWPLMAADEKQAGDIRKFEEIGTHPAANFLAISEALDFHLAIGAARKQARLAFLRERWTSRFTQKSEGLSRRKITIHTPLKPAPDGRPLACAIATFQIEGIDSAKVVEHLWEKHHILTTGIKHDEFEGVRVTPNVYTMPDQIDRFSEVVERIARDGLPA
jgi:selenocysteine lyase/cysteine desulfurase